MSSAEISRLQKEGSFTFNDNGEGFTVAKDDVEIQHEDLKGMLVETDGTIMVALDTEITPELRTEGYAREFVNRVQNLRKDSGFDVTDRISIAFSSGETLSTALLGTIEYIKRETLAVDLKPGISNGHDRVKEDINGEVCEISIEKILR
jgi:isoleucyl-tRNA synthetase